MAASLLDNVAWGKRLVSSITCPTCWHSFAPEDVLFVSRHTVGDNVLGGDEYQRFPPTRFNVKGEALDSEGIATADMACPRCHLGISAALLEVPPLFISMIGAPASGKSYLLATMTWKLRHMLPRAGLTFSDADALANTPLREYEDLLFMNPAPDQPTEIRKTQQDDPRLHSTATINGMTTRLVRPLQFTLWPTREHPNYHEPHRVGRVVVCYDNAGEDCLPGADVSGSLVVRHLAQSSILMMVFDPAQDPRFREMCQSNDPQLELGRHAKAAPSETFIRQEMVLNEAGSRIRRFLGLSHSSRLDKPLMILVSKFDMLSKASGISIDEEPFAFGEDGQSIRSDVERIDKTSKRLRDLFNKVTPDFVAMADSLSDTVSYIPVSSLGCSPEIFQRGEDSFYGVRPRDIRPKWVTAPLLYCLTRHLKSVLSHSLSKK